MSQSRLFAKLLENEITDAEREQLNQLLHVDPELRRLYRKYMTLDAMLRWEIAPPLMRVSEEEREAADSPVGGINPESGVSVPSIVVDPSPAGFSFVGSMAFSYMVATIVLCAMLLSAWAYRVTHRNVWPDKLVETLPYENEMIFVGRITGTVDCKWAASSMETIAGASVPLGRKYELTSGLLEITYASGARVILEGPCSYTVDSEAGGYLKQGKLVARVERKVASGQWPVASAKPQAANPHPPAHSPQPPTSSLSTLHSPLFTITTPTAVVTDLGTEFGVEVDEDGVTESHVIQGVVDVRAIAFKSGEAPHYRVEKGHAVCVDSSGKTTNVLFASSRFVRQLTDLHETPVDMEYVNAVLADKPLGYWPLNESAYARKFTDLSGNGRDGIAIGNIRSAMPGPAGGWRSVYFDGESYIQIGRQDDIAMTDGFTVEAWLLPDEDSTELMRVISADNCATPEQRTGWSLAYSRIPQFQSSSSCLVFTAYEIKDAVFENLCQPTSEWMHVVLIVDKSNKASLYLNARKQSTVDIGSSILTGPIWLSIGAISSRRQLWRGRLAHLAVYPVELSKERISEHYILAGETDRKNNRKEVQNMAR